LLVVGVLPASFDFGSVFAPGQKMDVFVPVVMDILRNWGNTLAVVGRLKPGVSVAQAQAEADVLFPRFKAAHPEWWGDYGSTLTGLKEHVSGKLRRSLLTLWCAVGLILLIVCVNLSNLQMARTAARGKEFAVRAALGAGRARLCRQLLTESLALTGAGALLGLGLAAGLTLYVARQQAITLPLLNGVRVDVAAFCWTLAVAGAAALLFGLVTGIKSYAGNPQETLKSGGPGMTAGRGHERLRASLVVAEVALACVLLTGAGLLLRSFLRVLDIDLGFQPARAAVVKIDYDDGGKRERRGAILQEILRNITAIPGIERAGIADMLPLGRNRSWGLRAKGMEQPKGDSLAVVVRIVTPGYLDAMGIRLRAGRDFTWADSATSEPVFIINEATARLYWHGIDPVGRLARIGRRDVRVAGVVADVRGHTLEAPAVPEMYIPMTQDSPEGAELVVRTGLPLKEAAPAILQTLRRLNPAQPAAEVRPLQHIVDRATSPRRFFVALVGAFAALGLLLASLGIYGVISYSVTRQTQEIGIRMALGASGGQVRAAVVKRSLRLAAAGAALGAIGSFGAARGIASLLFGTRPEDPVVFAGVILLLCAVALGAGYIPARRASRIEPILALRVG
jgi:predicted permease